MSVIDLVRRDLLAAIAGTAGIAIARYSPASAAVTTLPPGVPGLRTTGDPDNPYELVIGDGSRVVAALPSGGGLGDFELPAPEAVKRPYAEKVGESISAEDFYKSSDPDDTAMWQRALAFAKTNAPIGRTIKCGDPRTLRITQRLAIGAHGIILDFQNATLDYRGTGEAIGCDLVGATYPVEATVRRVNIRLVDAVGPVVGLRMRTSYATVEKVNVLIGAGIASGAGIDMFVDPTGANPGPYYSRVSDCTVDSQSGSTNHFGFRTSTGAPTFNGANANNYHNCCAGSCLIAFRVNGSGITYTGCHAEFSAGSAGTIAYDFLGQEVGQCVGNVVTGGYIEGASTAYNFSSLAVANVVVTGYGTGVTNWVAGAGKDNQTILSANIATQFATGISFSAPSTDPKALDAYEEVAFTPGLTFTTPGDLAVTYGGSNAGYATRIGNRVSFDLDLHLTAFAFSTAAGAAIITGLPFAAGAGSPGGGTITYMAGIDFASGSTFAAVALNAGMPTMGISVQGDSLASANATTAQFASGTVPRLQISGQYRVG